MDGAAGKPPPSRNIPQGKLTCGNRESLTENRHEREASIWPWISTLFYFPLFNVVRMAVNWSGYTLSIPGGRPEHKSMAILHSR